MEVTLVGTTTRGKNEASVTLYDAPKSDFRNRAEANPNHRWAMQPIIAKVANAQNFYEYGDGFTPDIEVDEIEFFDIHQNQVRVNNESLWNLEQHS